MHELCVQIYLEITPLVLKLNAVSMVTQIYLDWANHYLRKAGQTLVLNDLKDISDGYYLPQVIQAVGE